MVRRDEFKLTRAHEHTIPAAEKPSIKTKDSDIGPPTRKHRSKRSGLNRVVSIWYVIHWTGSGVQGRGTDRRRFDAPVWLLCFCLPLDGMYVKYKFRFDWPKITWWLNWDDLYTASKEVFETKYSKVGQVDGFRYMLRRNVRMLI